MEAVVTAAVEVMEMVAWMQVVKAQGKWLLSSGGRDEERDGMAAVGKWLGLCKLEPMVLDNMQYGEWMVVTEEAYHAPIARMHDIEVLRVTVDEPSCRVCHCKAFRKSS